LAITLPTRFDIEFTVMKSTIGLALLMLVSDGAVPTAEQDAARIEQLVLAELSGTPSVASEESGPAFARPSKAPNPSAGNANAADPSVVSFDQLRSLIGKRVRFTTKSGHRHVAIVDAVDGSNVRLLVRMPGGQATYNLTRGQIAQIKRI